MSERTKTPVLWVLGIGAGLAWILVLWQWHAMACPMCRGMSVACPMCMGTGRPFVVSLALFLGMWTSMMAAMMLPSVTPMVLLFQRVSKNRIENGGLKSPVWIFAAGYLIAWALTGFAGFAVVRAVQTCLRFFPSLVHYSGVIAGTTLIFAGPYPLRPFKERFLRHCRTPLDFLMEGWRDGKFGALRMGMSHALYCIGCCWGLMVVMFAVGLMNLTWMIGLTVVMAVEKISDRGVLIGRFAGVVFLGLGTATMAHLF